MLYVLRARSSQGQAAPFLATNLAVGLAHFLVLFNAGAYLPMIPYIAGSLGRAPMYGDWTQDLYFLFLGLGLPLARWVSGRWGARDGLLACLAVLLISSAINASTSNYNFFLLARIFSGLAGGLSIPLSLQLLLRHYHEDHRSSGLFLWGFAAITPFALGPFIGGWIADAWGWRWLFYLNLPVLWASILGILFWEAPSQRGAARMDWPGYGLLCFGLLALLMACNLSSKDDWWRSGEFRFLFVAGVVLLGAFFQWLPLAEKPVVDYRLFRQRNVLLASLGIFLTALAFQGSLALLIVQYQLSFAYSARAIGQVLLSLALFAPLSAWLSHWILGRFDPRPWAVLSMLLLAVGAFWLSSYDLPVSPSALAGPPTLVGLGLGGVFGSWARIGVWGLAGTSEQEAAMLLNLLRSSGQALGIPLVAALWERRMDLFRHFLVEDQGSNLAAWHANLAQFRIVLGESAAQKDLAEQVHLHAAMLAFNEVFYWAGWIFAGLACWSLLAKRPRPSGESRIEKLAAVELVEP